MADKKLEIVKKLNDERQSSSLFFDQLEDNAWETAVYHEETQWTITDILRHLVDSERGMTNMMMQWQQGNDPVPPDFDLARWNNRVVQKSANKSPEELLENMRANRIDLLSFIDTLQDEDWEKKGRHASLRIMSIEEVCHLIADHERDHLRVMQEVLTSE